MKRALLVAATLALAGLAVAKPVTYTLPAEKSTLKVAAGDGYQKAQNLCGVCHSRDYVTTQPRGKGKDFWTAEVKKMVTVYGAPIVDADVGPIAEYLASNY